MRGFAGWVTTGRAAIDDGALLPMLEALTRRGAADLVGFADRSARRQAVLGATLCDRAARVSVALDGAIGNASELRAELAKRGHAFTRGSDAEVLLRAYQQWGKDAVKHLRGAFAFALWDTGRECLLLARDRFGEKPLYLLEKGGALFFASEVQALLAAPGFAAEADLQSVWQFLACRYVPGPRTLFSGIRKLAPATCLQWQFGRVQEIRYWIAPDRAPGAANEGPGAPRDVVEAFIARLEEATRERCTDAGGAVLLSGGIDSAVLVALASRGGTGVKTFALGFEGDPASELPQAAAVAGHFATAHQEIVVKPAELIPDLAKLVAGRGAPSSRPSDLAIQRLAAEASRGASTLLTGDGGDEILGGYRRHVAERFAWGFAGVPSVLGLLAPLARSANSKSALASLRLSGWRERQLRWNGALTAAERDRLSVLDVEEAGEGGTLPPFDADPRASSLRRVLYFDQMSSLPGQLLERNDRAGAAAGVELRMPFLDHRLAEYVSALPDDRRVRGLATKWILRQAGKQLIPEDLASRKGGFRLPVRDWLRNELRDNLLDHLQGSASRTRQYYDSARLDRMLDEHLKGKNNHEIPLWTLLNLEIWHRQYKPA